MKTYEADEQEALFEWAEAMTFQYPELETMYHISNEGKRSKAAGARLKRQGLKRGVSDICLPAARCGYHGLYIELKTAEGKATEEQKEFIIAVRRQGYAAFVCHGWQQASELLTQYMKGSLQKK